MRFAPQVKIPATYMRGGTSKGVFLNLMIYLKQRSSQGEFEIKFYCASLAVQTLMPSKLMEWAVQLQALAKR